VEAWYLAVYVDAVEWVELPNTGGMALHASGGRFTSKPYVASGAYIKRMSNYCSSCRYKPEVRTGADACPYTTLYWNFLIRNQVMLAQNPRTALMVTHVNKMTEEAKISVEHSAQQLLQNMEQM
jgi:deoxyribodipyrimidine photolyase-related protein